MNWMGSLIYESRDASGLHYRRNRFYDAEAGRFTQEDPIGMAGGINVYGFGNGDPVGYSDPYGLSAEQCCQITDWGSLVRHIIPKHVEGRQGPASLFQEGDPAALRSMISETVGRRGRDSRRAANREWTDPERLP
jgi:RHS repeat-associated protein